MFLRFFPSLSTRTTRNAVEEIDKTFINYRKKYSEIVDYQYNENFRCHENS